MYNTTNITGATDISGLAVAANQATGNLLFIVFIIAIFIVLMMSFKRFEQPQIWISASWITFIIALLFNFAGLVPLFIVLVFLAMGSFGVLLYFIISRD